MYKMWVPQKHFDLTSESVFHETYHFSYDLQIDWSWLLVASLSLTPTSLLSAIICDSEESSFSPVVALKSTSNALSLERPQT